MFQKGISAHHPCPLVTIFKDMVTDNGLHQGGSFSKYAFMHFYAKTFLLGPSYCGFKFVWFGWFFVFEENRRVTYEKAIYHFVKDMHDIIGVKIVIDGFYSLANFSNAERYFLMPRFTISFVLGDTRLLTSSLL